jgi:hypothetical protein
MTTIDAVGLTDRLVTNKTLKITNKAEQGVAKKNLKNSAKLQLAIAYLFHNKDTEIGNLTIDVGNGTITENGGIIYTIDDNVLLNNNEFPITAKYQKASGDLIAAGFVTDGNFYDGFFSMFDGQNTSASAKKPTKKSKRGGKKH